MKYKDHKNKISTLLRKQYKCNRKSLLIPTFSRTSRESDDKGFGKKSFVMIQCSGNNPPPPPKKKKKKKKNNQKNNWSGVRGSLLKSQRTASGWRRHGGTREGNASERQWLDAFRFSDLRPGIQRTPWEAVRFSWIWSQGFTVKSIVFKSIFCWQINYHSIILILQNDFSAH